jgi:hypothetical protein
MMIDWVKISQDAGTAFFNWANAVRISMGLGGGVGVIKLLAHIPAPRLGSMVWGTFFDLMADIVSNGRVGERRKADGEIVYIIKPPRPKATPEPAAVVTYETAAMDKPDDKSADKSPDKPLKPLIYRTDKADDKADDDEHGKGG